MTSLIAGYRRTHEPKLALDSVANQIVPWFLRSIDYTEYKPVNYRSVVVTYSNTVVTCV